MASPSRLQIYEVERSDDHGGVCTVRCIAGIARIGQVFASNDSSEDANADSNITLTAIERYRKSVDFFDSPNTARVSLSGNSAKDLGRGSILSCVHESRELAEVARKILAGDSRVRERGADELTDQLSSFSPTQASALATMLSAAATVEKENSALEAELHAILELMSTGHISLDHVSPLREIHLGDLPPELREYVTDLLEG